jgi:hypothetical protein
MAAMLSYLDFTDDIQLDIPTIRDAEFTDFCQKKESEFLRKILGVTMYDQFVSGLAVLPSPEQKWIDIRDGKKFEYHGKMFYFEGVKESLKYYTYIKYQQKQLTINVTSGNVAQKNSNSYDVSIVPRLVDANFKCLDQCEMLLQFIEANKTIYTDFQFGLPFENRFNNFAI